jgi:hypothetical protein
MTYDSQEGFANLSASSWQHDGFMPTLVCHESFSGNANSAKSKERPFKFNDDDMTIPATLLLKQEAEEEIIMMVDAFSACELSRVEAWNACDNLLAASRNRDSIAEPLRRITNPAPPIRFRRRGILWASITRRMLLLAHGATTLTRKPPYHSNDFNHLPEL